MSLFYSNSICRAAGSVGRIGLKANTLKSGCVRTVAEVTCATPGLMLKVKRQYIHQGTTMSDFYLGQVMLTGFGFAPKGFAQCNGQLLPITQNQALFSLLGITYGGNGVSTFALPDLRGRLPVGYGASTDPNWQPTNYPQGTAGGVEAVTLLQANLPAHAHVANATTAAGVARNPNNAMYGTPSESIFGPSGNLVPLAPTDIGLTGSTQPHSNMQPFLAINFNIALTGVFPTRS